MKLEKKVYETRSEKRRDFWIGFGGWFGINVPLAVLVVFVGGLAIPWSGTVSSPTGLPLPAVTILWVLSLLINLAGLIVLAITRSWIALGALAAMSAVLLLAFCAGLASLAWCFTQPVNW